ncbi:MAG: discoidin domain-containing protein [Chloroflexota bacterium]|nr:discoidin domain-containing protein [Chloroflexota bacterium]
MVGAALFLVLVPAILPAFPNPLLTSLSPGIAKAAEVLNAPEFIQPAVLPNGQVGIVFLNDDGCCAQYEIRFKRYFDEWGLDPSQTLSTANSWYPQLATFQGKVIAGYVDNISGSPTFGKFLFRVSTDGGSTWGLEYAPFGTETFNYNDWAPLLITSRDGSRLYFFNCCVGGTLPGTPLYRYTTDPGLASWTAAAAAGDSSMAIAQHNNCGGSGQECYRAHNFSFTENVAGQWVYVAMSTGASAARATQVGPLGGSWSAQVDMGGQGGIFHGSSSNPTTFRDRSGNVYFLQLDEIGQSLFSQKSTDGGYSWGPQIQAYSNTLDWYTTGSPVGLYVPGYTKGEYVWYAGFGGVGNGNDQNAARVIPLWTAPKQYVDTGTVRLFGSLGGDYDFGTAYPYTFGRGGIPTGIGAYKTSAEDLAVPGRLLNLSFSRSYNSADTTTSSLGPAWTHNFNWQLTDAGSFVQLRRGDGRQDTFTKNPDASYADPPNVFDVLTKNGDSTFTLTLKNQTQYEFSTVGKLTRIHEPAGNQILLNYTAGKLASVTDTVGRVTTFAYSGGFNLAQGKTYTKSVAASPSFPDTDGLELTDGTVPNANDQGDQTWEGHSNLAAPLDVTVDLGSSQSLGLVRSFYYEDTGAQSPAFKPTTVEIQTSPDNLTYTSQGSTAAASAVNDAGRRWQYDLTTSVSARYVRFHITAGGTWLMSGEMQVFLAGSPPISAQAGNNLGAGKPYTESVATYPGYPDTNGTELTDNNLGDPTYRFDSSWQGHGLGSTPLDVTVDLGTAQRVGVVRSYHFQGTGYSMFRPTNLELFTSTDNISFVSRGKTVGADAVNDLTKGEGARWRYELDLMGVSARWVRFRFTAVIGLLMSSELQIFAEGAGPITTPLSYGDRLISLTDPSGRKVTYGYDQNGRLTRVVDKLGNAAGQDPTLHSWHYGYDPQGQHIAAVVDPDSRTRVANTYNTEGRLASQKDGAGNTSGFTYGNQITMVTDPRGHLTTQLFDPRWRLSSQSDTVNLIPYVLQYFYEDVGQNLTATIDRNGNRTDYTYDTRGNVLTKTDPQVPPAPRYLTTFVYDTKNNLTQITDARSFVTTNAYDPASNVKLSTTQQITTGPSTYATTKWEYGDATNPGLPTKIISPRGNTTGTPNYTYSQSRSYDTSGNLIQRIDADTYKTTFGYDGLSRQTTMVDPDGYSPTIDPSHHTWTTVYDENDRVTEVRDPLSHSTFSSYDGAGDRLTVTDRDGNVTTYAYDGAARLASVKQKPDPVGQPTLVYTTAVVRDANGNASQVTQDHQGAAGSTTVVTDYGYDDINRLTSFTTHPGTPPNLTTSYILDGDGNPTQRTTGDNVQTNYQYDALSRLKQVSAAGLGTITYGYDELSRRNAMTDGTGNSTYSYDGLGRLTQAVQPNGTLGYGYDLDSNRTTLTYPTVGSVTYVFSPAGRLASLTDWGSRQSTYTYTASGLAKTVTIPGGMTTNYTYDTAQRLWTLVNSTTAGTITSDTYTLDNEGNRTAIDEIANGVLASAKVNTDTGTAVQDHPAIALGADAATYLVWDDQRNGATNSDIFFSKRDATTGLWLATDVKVNTDTGTHLQQNPAISMDSSNNAYAVWQDDRNGSAKPDIYYSKRTAAGTWLTPNLKVSDDPGASGGAIQRNPRIAGTSAGAETAVWVDLRSSQNNIYSSTLASGGSIWAANKTVTDNTAAVKDFPDVAVGSDGTSYAVWQDSRNGNADIYFSTLTSGGSAWAANTKISDDPGTTAQTLPRIGIDGSGNLIAAWVDARTSPAHVRVARKPSGGSWSASVDISPSPANVQSLALSVRSDGYAWITWGDTRAGAGNQDIWGSRYDPYLATWATPVRLDDDPGTTANQLNPTVAFSASEIMLGWRDNRLSANGNIQARRAVFVPGLTDHFALTYDGLNRLKAVTGPVAESFALDGASNITSRTGPSQTDSYDNSNRLTSDGTSSYTWSNADRLTNRGSDTFAYDALDRMTSSTVGGTARTYAYNGDSLLQSRTQGSTTTFLWDPSSSPSRELKQGNDNIIYGLGPLYVVKSDATTVTFARDGSKNVRAEINSSGAVTAAFRYRAYGQTSQTISAPPAYLGYASQLQDPSALLFMRARWYDPASTRFLSRDPEMGDVSAPRTLNLYSYAGANPVVLSDPSGRCFFVCGAVIGLVAYTATKFIEARINNSDKAFGSWDPREAAIATAAGALTQGASVLITGLAVKTVAIGAIGAASSLVNDATAGREPDVAKSYVDSAASMAGSFVPGGAATVTAVLVGVPTTVGFGLATDWLKEQIDNLEQIWNDSGGKRSRLY